MIRVQVKERHLTVKRITYATWDINHGACTPIYPLEGQTLPRMGTEVPNIDKISRFTPTVIWMKPPATTPNLVWSKTVVDLIEKLPPDVR